MSDAVIRDPSTGLAANVTNVHETGHLFMRAMSSPAIQHISRHGELAFSWTSTDYDYDAGDTILLVQNTSSTSTLYITDIYMYTDTATLATIHATDGATFTLAGTSITGVNLNRKSGKVADASAFRDETGNTQGSVILNVRLGTNAMNHVTFEGALALGNANEVAVDYVTAGTAAVVTILGYYE